MYEQIPTILRPQEILDKAFGRAAKIEKYDREAFYRFRKTAIARTESTKDILTETLTRYVKAFPNLDRVDTYERELVEVLVGVDPLRQALGRVSGVASASERWCDAALREIKSTRDMEEIRKSRERLVGRISHLVGELEEPLAFLAEARARFRRIPHVTPGDLTIVVAGYPNVGKSSLLAGLSNARPEIAPYAFTTKHVNVGHFLEPGKDDLHARRFQLVDTPGLLEKPPQERNPIEMQAALALRHLADLILFVIDPTETCGYTVAAQEALLAALRDEFEGIPLLIVENKGDLAQAPPPSDRLRVSCTTGEGIDALRDELIAKAPKDTFAERLAREQLPE